MMSTFLVTLLGLVASTRGQIEGPTFHVTGVDGPLPAAPLLAMTAEFTVHLGGKQPRSVDAGQWVALRRAGTSLPSRPSPPFLVLSTADRLPLATPLDLSLEDERFQATPAEPLRAETGKFLRLPQAAIAAVCLTSPVGNDDLERWLPDERKPGRPHDALVLRNGDRLEGTLLHLDSARGAVLGQGDRKIEVPFDRLMLVTFNPELQARPRAGKMYVHAVLRSGARLRFTSLTLKGGEWLGALPFGPALALPTENLVSLQLRHGQAVYLDELKPLAYEATPFLDLTWPLATGRTLLGRPLRLGGDVYDSGLAMHSRSRVTYALDGGYQAFEATVGVDAQAGRRGTVTLSVEVDGKLHPGAPQPLRADDPPAHLRVDVRGGRRLTLITDFGPLGDVQGHALWADARLLRTK